VGRALERVRVDLPTWRVADPQGGSVLWAELPLPDSGPFVQLASRHGVQIAPGSVARADRVPDPHVRICVDRPWQIVDVGLQRLAWAWRDLDAGSGPVLG
jgi:DNA-binding transcriptional MocR family regulator